MKTSKKPPARHYHSACIIDSDIPGHHPLLMVVGGWGDGETLLSDVWFLDVTSRSWHEVYSTSNYSEYFILISRELGGLLLFIKHILYMWNVFEFVVLTAAALIQVLCIQCTLLSCSLHMHVWHLCIIMYMYICTCNNYLEILCLYRHLQLSPLCYRCAYSNMYTCFRIFLLLQVHASLPTARFGHSAVVFGTGSDFRVVVLFGGRTIVYRWSETSETTLLLLCE